MMNASRAQIDLEALARDLRHEGAAPRPTEKPDPLAELARIVGQDDPFRALLDARNQIGANFASPNAEEAPRWDLRAEPHFAPEEPVRANPADAFDQYLASVERDMQLQAPEEGRAFAVEEPTEPYDDAMALRRKSPRRRLVSVGAGIAVVAVAVTGALTYKGLHATSSGGSVPLVQADTTPLKVAPKVADGVEIPDQNRQIYDRNATSKDSSGPIKIVNREEQPLDVAEAARATGAPPANQGTTTPGSSPFEAFGEPRRVRTVAVKPEAPPAPAPAPVAEAEAPVSPMPTMVLPTSDPTPVKPARTVRSADALAGPISPVSEPAPEAASPAKTKPTPVPVAAASKKAPQRVASVADTMQVSPETTQATSASIDTTSPVSGYSVQLGVRNSASDARAALHQMQAKFSKLAGKPELIRQAEVNGKTIFRVRVGPLAKDEASSLCSALQGEGGQCFVAKN